MTQQHLNDPDIDPAFEQVRGKAVSERMDADTLGQACSLSRRAAGRVEDRDGNRHSGGRASRQ